MRVARYGGRHLGIAAGLEPKRKRRRQIEDMGLHYLHRGQSVCFEGNSMRSGIITTADANQLWNFYNSFGGNPLFIKTAYPFGRPRYKISEHMLSITIVQGTPV